jgi:hypothetical protein
MRDIWWDIITRCLAHEPSSRPTMARIQEVMGFYHMVQGRSSLLDDVAPSFVDKIVVQMKITRNRRSSTLLR